RPTGPRASRPRARRGQGPMSPVRNALRRFRTDPWTSSRLRDKVADLVVVLDPRLALEPGGCVDGPGTHGAHSRAHVVGTQTARQHHPSLGGRCTVEVKRVLFVPWEIDDLRDDLIPAEQDGVASADASVLTAVELDEVGSGLLCVADEDRDAEAV